MRTVPLTMASVKSVPSLLWYRLLESAVVEQKVAVADSKDGIVLLPVALLLLASGSTKEDDTDRHKTDTSTTTTTTAVLLSLYRPRPQIQVPMSVRHSIVIQITKTMTASHLFPILRLFPCPAWGRRERLSAPGL